MGLPRFVTIAGRRWWVRHRKPPHNGRGKRPVGCVYNTKREIYVSHELSKKRQVQVLIHEVLHACYWDLGEEAIERGEDAIWDALKNFIHLDDDAAD